MSNLFKAIESEISSIPDYQVLGVVSAVRGLRVEVRGLNIFATIGSRCEIVCTDGRKLLAEVVGVHNDTAYLMAFADLAGVGFGDEVRVVSVDYAIYPSLNWLGRVVDCFGQPIDSKGPLVLGEIPYFLKQPAPPAHQRQRLGNKIDMGVKAINSFLSCCRGQRLGIFAGSGVGKSMLIAMLSKYASTDVKVVGLVGERGREVQEFLHDYLGEEGLKQTVVVAATSDESALARRQAAYTTMAIAEFFRDQGKEVLCMMDSITRFAMAQREIGLSSGEPPTTKGYTPSVFSELPKILERAGPGTANQGNITALISVLVEGDDTNEPIADAVRGILDGHIVLDRKIAARGRYPAIDINRSISRSMPNCNTEYENKLVTKARSLIATYEDMADMIRIGAYKKGADPKVDEAIKFYDILEEFLKQAPSEKVALEDSYIKLAETINFPSRENSETKDA
jgi:flagellum-specific ATP synthase